MKCRIKLFIEYSDGEIEEVNIENGDTDKLPYYCSKKFTASDNQLLKMCDLPTIVRVLVSIIPRR